MFTLSIATPQEIAKIIAEAQVQSQAESNNADVLMGDQLGPIR